MKVKGKTIAIKDTGRIILWTLARKQFIKQGTTTTCNKGKANANVFIKFKEFQFIKRDHKECEEVFRIK